MRRTIDRGSLESGTYTCQYDWPTDCFVQCGGSGLVVAAKSMDEAFADPVETVGQVLGVTEAPQGSYRTAFFEAFPRNPNTFLRGEGTTIEEAETAAWKKYQTHSACEHPAFEKRGYTNGAGFCVECDMFSSKHFAPWENCKHCDYPIYPNENGECFHCDLFTLKGEESESDSYMVRYRERTRIAAINLIHQNIHCPDCDMRVMDMRLVSSSDYRLSEEERERQHKLYQKAIHTITKDQPLFSRPDRNLTFPFSVFYECKCDSLKLIVDLIGESIDGQIKRGSND